MRSREELEEFILSGRPEKTIRHLCYKYGCAEYAEDAYHEYVVALLEGKSQHQTIDQFFYDFSRKMGWKVARAKKDALNKATSIEAMPGYEVVEQRKIGEQVESLEAMSKIRHTKKRIATILKYHYGFKLTEIGALLGVCESRVSQILTMPDGEDRNGTLTERLADESKARRVLREILRDERKKRIEAESKLAEAERTLRKISAPPPAADIVRETVMAQVEVDHDLFDLASQERKLIFMALESTNWHKTNAAAKLGICVRTLRNKLKEYMAQGIPSEKMEAIQ